MKTILLISHSSAIVGGGEDDFLRLLKFLQGKYTIYSVFPDEGRADDFAVLSDKYVAVPNRPYPGNFFRIKPILAFLFYTVKKLFVLIPFLRKNRKNIDLCFVNSSVCFVEMRLLKFFSLPYVVSVKEKINPCFVRKYVYRLIDKSASKVIVISNYLKDLLSHNIKKKEISIIRASIDDEIYNALKSEVTVRKSTDKFIVLNIGQIYSTKNQLLLIEAVNKLNNKDSILVKFIGFIADHKYNNELLKKVNEYGLKNTIEFFGALSKKEIIEEYMNSDAVVITSKEEGMSLILVEALFLNKPVISTSVGIIPEVIINGENGMIIDSGNPDSLSQALEKLIRDKTFYNKIVDNSYNSYKNNFDLKKSLNEHLLMFEECINKHNKKN